jgi:hypothetical protein
LASTFGWAAPREMSGTPSPVLHVPSGPLPWSSPAWRRHHSDLHFILQ